VNDRVSQSLGAPGSELDPKTWETARRYVQHVGAPHRLFVSGIRALRSVQPGETAIVEHDAIVTLFRSESVKTILFHAAKALCPERFSGEQISGRDLLLAFKPDQLCGVIASAYLFRLVGRKVERKIWEALWVEIESQMETGVLVGSTIPAIGACPALVMGAVRYIAMSLFSVGDERGFKAYRRELEDHSRLFDLKHEVATWGCSHLQIASLCLQSLGFGIAAANGVCMPRVGLAGATMETLQWYAARRWIESLIETESAPEEFGEKSPFHPADALAFADLQRGVEKIYSQDRGFNWIEKGRGDLEQEVIKQLRFAATAKARPSEVPPKAE